MTLLIKYRDSLLIVSFTGKSDHITDWGIALNEIAVLRDSTLVKESLALLIFSAIVINLES